MHVTVLKDFDHRLYFASQYHGTGPRCLFPERAVALVWMVTSPSDLAVTSGPGDPSCKDWS